jgi:hypothetical protein
MVSSAAAACLPQDATQTWFLDASTGSVTWSILQDHVRSDAGSAAHRLGEETTFIEAARTGDHPVARGFRQLGMADPRTRILRDVVPFSVLTDVDAGRIDVLGRQFALGLGNAGSSSVLTSDGTTWEWTWTLSESGAPSADRQGHEDVAALGDHLDSLVVMIEHGRFEDATGFDLSPDRRAAKLRDPDDERGTAKARDAAAPDVFRLRWTSQPGSAAQ